MANLFFGIGLITLLLGVGAIVVASMANMGIFFVAAGFSTVGSSLFFFALYAIIDRLDKIVEATLDRRELVRIEPK